MNSCEILLLDKQDVKVFLLHGEFANFTFLRKVKVIRPCCARMIGSKNLSLSLHSKSHHVSHYAVVDGKYRKITPKGSHPKMKRKDSCSRENHISP